jgi:hypothetical protein
VKVKSAMRRHSPLSELGVLPASNSNGRNLQSVLRF